MLASYDPTSTRFRLPHVGGRILKTTLAVFICLVIYRLRGYTMGHLPAEAAITAIICMQPYVQDSRKYAFDRFTGSLIGAVWAVIFLLLLYADPILSKSSLIFFAVMSAGVLCSLYSAVLMRLPDAACLAGIVFLCIAVAFPQVDPVRGAVNQMLDVFIGTTVAIVVNVFRLPVNKHPERVFFVRTKDLVPDRFSHPTPTVLYLLNHLYDDGARICMMGEHAPAFFTLQMSAAKLNTPLIVMDGAAIYDLNDNEFLWKEPLPVEESEKLRRHLDELGISYFVYTIHSNKTCIFHQGKISSVERRSYDRMKRSPYRSYLEGEIYDPAEIVYIKIIAEDRKLTEIENKLRPALRRDKLRSVRRSAAEAPGVSALYVYSRSATMQRAAKRLMEMLNEKEPELVPVEVEANTEYRSERDAIHLLNQIERKYAPLKILDR